MKSLGLIAGAAVSLSSVALAQSTTDESRALANELVSDSATRASLLAPATVFTPKVGGYEQFRYVLNTRDNTTSLDANGNKTTIGFQNARTRLNLGGNVLNEDWSYFIQFGFGDSEPGTGQGVGTPPVYGENTGGAFLEDAYMVYKMGSGWDLTVGQFKNPFTKEQLVGDTNQLAMDRSVEDDVFNTGRTQGVMVGYSADAFRVMVAFTDGARALNTDYTSAREADFSVAGRGEWKWAGDWKQANDFTSWQNSQFFGMVGGALHWQNGGSTVGTTDASYYAATVDVMVKGNGWNAFANGIYGHFDPNVGPSQDNYGILLQGGIFVAAQWELFGRYDYIGFSSNTNGSEGQLGFGQGAGNHDNFDTIAAGVNYYISPDSQAIKFTAEVEFFLTKWSTSNAPADTMTGLLAPNDKAGQIYVAGQLQMVF
jgi:hypothetical protein